MLRRVAVLFSFSVSLSFGGFLFLSGFSFASEPLISEVAFHDGSIDNNADWRHDNCSTSSSANPYLILKSNNSLLESPELDLSGCVGATIIYSARSYGGVSYLPATSSQIHVYASAGGIENLLSIDTPTADSNPIRRPEIDISSYCGQKIKIIFKSLNATGSKGFGLDDIKVAVSSSATNTPPLAAAGGDREAEIDEAVEFDGSNSYDPDAGDHIVQWLWDFGAFQIPSATTSQSFNSSGTYSVSLSVKDSRGASSSPDSITIRVKDKYAATSTPTSTIEHEIGDVVINELVPAPSSGNSEWIELYNSTAEPIDLSGWIILNKEGQKYSTTTLSGIIDVDDFLVLESISGSLNNSGDEIVLKDNAGKIISQSSYGDFSGCYDCAWAHVSLTAYALTITPTKGGSNVITAKPVSGSGGSLANSVTPKVAVNPEKATSTATSTAEKTTKRKMEVVFNEAYPNPADGGEEFVELKNLGSGEENLSGLIISDASGKKFKIASSTPLKPQALAVVSRSQSGIALNNSGRESISLSYSDGEVIDLISYDGGRKGLSFSRKPSGEWQWSGQPTPGSDNIFDDAINNFAEAKLASVSTKATKKKASSSSKGSAVEFPLDQVRSLDNGAQVKVKGVVSVPPGILGAQIFYLSGSGIQVYSYKKLFPDLKIGDYIEVTGELAESGGERRIKTSDLSDIKVLERRNAPLPHQIAASEVGEDFEGSLVQIEADVLEIKSRNIYLDDGSGDEAKAYIKSHLAMQDVGVKAGDRIRLTGIVSQTSAGYRLLPRDLGDIEIIKGEVKGEFESANQKKAGKEYYLAALVIFLSAIVIFLIYKWPNKKIPS